MRKSVIFEKSGMKMYHQFCFGKYTVFISKSKNELKKLLEKQCQNIWL